MSTLLLIPWIILGYKNPSWRFLGLCQTKKSLLILFLVEIVYWLTLVLMTHKPGATAGAGSFAWQYTLFYEKGIIPVWWLSEKINPFLGDQIDQHYRILYLLAGLIMDYIFLFILSPRIPQIFSRNQRGPNTRVGANHK
jgi:hypothetical protein